MGKLKAKVASNLALCELNVILSKFPREPSGSITDLSTDSLLAALKTCREIELDQSAQAQLPLAVFWHFKDLSQAVTGAARMRKKYAFLFW